MQTFLHIMRTVAFVFVLAAVILLTLYLLPNWYGVGLVVLLLIGTVYYSAYWHVHSAPTTEPIRVIDWESATQGSMKTIVEHAIVEAPVLAGLSSIRHVSLRISIRDPKGRLTKTVIGDDAIYLGSYGHKLWFYISDRFYAKIDGLTAYSVETAEVLFNLPMEQGEYLGRVRKRKGVIRLEVDGVEQEFDLNELGG